MDAHPMTPFGQALLAYQRGDTDAQFSIVREDGFRATVPMSLFFRPEAEFSTVDRAGLAECRGHVLDIGAGSGLHSLALQRRGLTVTAIDATPEAVEVMRDRGVGDARCADFFAFSDGRFDTFLMLGHGIGIVQTLERLGSFFRHAEGLLAPGGQVLVHSVDVRATTDPDHLAYHEANRERGRYVGTIRLQFEYAGALGAPSEWLHVDPGTLREHAARAGWSFEMLLEEAEGEYLARLTPAPA